MKYLGAFATLGIRSRACLASFTNVERTNDQIDLCGGSSGRRSGAHTLGLGRPQPRRATACPGDDDGQCRRQLRAGFERWRVRFSALFATALHAEYL
jgi:hypothetical protein